MIKKTAQLIATTYCLLFPVSNYSQFESLSRSYNLLSTIAGNMDAKGDGDENLWKSEFEGGKATDAMLSGPHIAVADSMGNVYIADKNAHAIRKVDSAGIISTVAGTNMAGDGEDGQAITRRLNFPNGLWVSKDGTLYILDLFNSKIRKVDTSGKMTALIHDTAGMTVGRGLWVSRTEDTIWYCSGSKIMVWTDAKGLAVFADSFSGGLGNIVQDRNGNIIATDRTGNRVYRINQNGEKTVIAGTGSSSGGGNGLPALQTAFHGVRGVWVLEDNTYFLATHEGSQVWYIDSAGIAHVFVHGREGDKNHSGDGEHFQTPGYKVSEVRAVTVDYQGNLLVTENDRGFIRKLEKRTVSVMKRQILSKADDAVICQGSGEVTRLRFPISADKKPVIDIRNLMGQSISVPVKFRNSSTACTIEWDNRNLPSGIFLIRIDPQDGRILTKQVLINR